VAVVVGRTAAFAAGFAAVVGAGRAAVFVLGLAAVVVLVCRLHRTRQLRQQPRLPPVLLSISALNVY